jgi:hypothetical protein
MSGVTPTTTFWERVLRRCVESSDHLLGADAATHVRHLKPICYANATKRQGMIFKSFEARADAQRVIPPTKGKNR